MLTYEQKKQQKVKQLIRIQTFLNINRLLCIATVLPLFHMSACLGQKKKAPLISKVGTAVFGSSLISMGMMKRKEENTLNELAKMRAERFRS